MAIPIINVSILNGSNGFRLDGEAADDRLGYSVSNAGDVNGDGFDDVIIGARSYRSYSGFSYVVFGRDSDFAADIDLSSLDGNNGFRLNASGSNTRPYIVSDAGDVNGDGYDDVIIGAPGVYIPTYASYEGAGYVVFGRASGFTADINLSNLDGNNGFQLRGDISSSVTVSGAGDVNGDGFGDVIVGVSLADPNGFFSGSSYVVFGRASGFDATMELSNLNGSNGFRLDGVATRDRSGGSISNAGDVNGDGFDDLIIGAYGADPNGKDSGSSYVVFGRASGFSAAMDLSSLDGSNGFRLDGGAAYDRSGGSISNAGDVNGDGFDDVIVNAPSANPNDDYSGSSYVVFGKASGFGATLDLSSLDGISGFRLDGGSMASSAGDINGDGFDDLIVGAPSVDPNGINSGSSYVIFGKTSGFAATLDLSKLDGNDGFRLEGVSGSDQFGASVSGAGDVNSDGFDDLIIGARYAEPSGERSGSSYVVFGGDFITGEPIYLGTQGDDNLVGTTLAERFEAGGGNDRMTGLGGADIFHGDAGDDTIVVPDLGFQSVDGGAGSDTLELTGGSIHLDLANFTDTIDGIETINLTGSGDNTLTLTLPDLLSLSSTTNTFTVNGNGGDRIVGLSDGWTDGGIDGNYRVFTNSGTTLRVDRAVHTEVPISGVINLADLDGSNGFRLSGVNLPIRLVSSAGDVNGDGFDDVIISATRYGTGSYSAHNYVIFGKVSGFSATQDFTGLNGKNGFRLDEGGTVSNAGDVNGDGFADVIIGNAGAEPNGFSSGSSYVVFGKASGFSAMLNLSSLDGTNGFRLDGTESGDQSGASVSNAGDINGDGFDDVIIGAPYADPNGGLSGSSYIVFGKASGFSASQDLSSLDGNNGFRLDGTKSGDVSGYSVNSAGDVNGDGFDDVIVGARSASPNGEFRAGSSYVIFGKASGFAATLELSSLDGKNGFRLDGVAAYDNLGFSVSDAGDVNGDGLDDVIVGAGDADPNDNYRAGSSYVVFGRASGFDATLDLSTLDGSNGFRLDGGAEYDRAGRAVSNAGDVNGDGFDDVIIGAPGASPNGYNAYSSGSSYVIFGRDSGFDAILSLSSLDGSNGVRLDEALTGYGMGASVSGAGDVNGDGFDDLIVATLNGNPGYVIFGSRDFGGSSGGDNVIAGTPGNDALKGTSAADIFEAGDGNDRMIGRGGADVFHGGAGDDYIQVADLGFGSVDGSSGNDTLHLGGKDLNLDLANFGNKIHGIETICLYGRGDNTLTLTAEGLLSLSDNTNTLRVNGNAGDHITVQDDGWVDGGPRGSGYYHVYTHDDAVLLVGQNVTVDFA
ncbi:FG-GAP repeat protein [Nitrosomonas sp. Nm84]|uniref:beta strand repeat-containing protein n=1 Tax=Nitrosomonas sp. Nm84 TaxID=200124 RepID=UPI000D75BA79|nr:FG-GAP-like repeat-containing protein [Nitrosomonas sp. Nm84]PXW88243.1 FG-GAP repeat protein [Nitrosomonas sp. Nm84]